MDNMDFVQVANIKVMGVGGGGCNAIKNMIEEEVQGVEFYIINTDAQVLKNIDAPNKIILGRDLTHGLGAGGNPEVGKKAAQETETEIKDALDGANMVFIAAGLGGGTGTGAAPIIAKAAKDMGALTVGVVTTPFTFEGPKRKRQAEAGLEELKKSVDCIIPISNDRLLEVIGNIPMGDAFKEADNILRQSVQNITDLITTHCQINLDFADVSAVMKDRGNALIGIGFGEGDNKAEDAALAAVSSPLSEISISGAKDAIINITGGQMVTLQDTSAVFATINEAAGTEINAIYGVCINPDLGDAMVVTVIATGFEDEAEEVKTPVQPKRTVEPIKTQSEEIDDDFDQDVPSFLRNRRV